MLEQCCPHLANSPGAGCRQHADQGAHALGSHRTRHCFPPIALSRRHSILPGIAHWYWSNLFGPADPAQPRHGLPLRTV